MALEELTDLKGVWSELARIWEQIDELKEKPWLSVAPRKVEKTFMLVIAGVAIVLSKYAFRQTVLFC